jgi:hypothetical protein
MEENGTKTLTQSETFKWAVLALVAFATKRFGVDYLPDEISTELVTWIGTGLDVLIPICMGMAIRGRKKATQVIDRWF